MNTIYQEKNFIDNDSINLIINSFKPLKIETGDPFVKTFTGSFITLPIGTDDRLIVQNQNHIGLNDQDYEMYVKSVELINKILLLQKQVISTTYGVNLKQRFLNYVVTETGGGYDGYHTDSTMDDGSPRMPQGMEENIWNTLKTTWSDHGRYWYSSIIYLNDDYLGGEIEFMGHQKIKPEPGEMIYFIGDQNTQHGVRKVISGERHAIVSFYWEDKYEQEYLGAK
jgi:hypothetical protein